MLNYFYRLISLAFGKLRLHLTANPNGFSTNSLADLVIQTTTLKPKRILAPL